MHGSISSEMADFRNGREPIGMQPGRLKIDKKKPCIFLCWKCTYVGYVYPVVDSFKFSREDETRLSTKAEYAQSMIPSGRLVYGHLLRSSVCFAASIAGWPKTVLESSAGARGCSRSDTWMKGLLMFSHAKKSFRGNLLRVAVCTLFDSAGMVAFLEICNEHQLMAQDHHVRGKLKA